MKEAHIGKLIEVAETRGEAFVGGANRPITLQDADICWVVVRGALDVFVSRIDEDGEKSEPRHLLRAGPGRVVFPLEDELVTFGETVVLTAKGLQDTELRRVPQSALSEVDVRDEFIEQVEIWVSEFAASVARSVPKRPRFDLLLSPGSKADVQAGQRLASREGLLWVSKPERGAIAFLGTEQPLDSGPALVPVTSECWLEALQSSRVSGATTAELDRDGQLMPALAEFHRLALQAEDVNGRLLLTDVANWQMARIRHRDQSAGRAHQNLLDVLDTSRFTMDESGDLLLSALNIVGGYEGIEFAAPPGRWDSPEEDFAFLDILDASEVRWRQIGLHQSDRWWLGNSGAMLAFRREDGQPVALLPGLFGRYKMLDPKTGRSERVNAKCAGALQQDAFFFYRSLPRQESPEAGMLFRLAFHRLGGDVARFGLAGLLVGLLMLVPPILLGILVNDVLMGGTLGTLVGLTTGLVLLALLAALLQTIQGTALMRLEGRATARAIAALWDRLMDLSPRFFRRFTAGDLSVRVMALQVLRDRVSGVVANAVLSVVFLMPTFVLIFIYDTALGWAGLLLGLLALATTVSMGFLQIERQRRMYEITRHLTSLVFQLVKGIGKLRSTGTEDTAFALWARSYREQKQIEMRIGQIDEHLIAFTSAAPLLASAVLFAIAMYRGEEGLRPGDFLAAQTAFLTFYAAIAMLGRSFSAIATIVPACEQVVPITREVPDMRRAGGAESPKLVGDLRFDQVTFGYLEDGPPVLRDISIHARPGEFIALVGESGAGKTTVFRLALGLEDPWSGAVYHDNRDVVHLNVRALRKQVGIVVQAASLRPGTVLDNITGVSSDLSLEDAWRAARLAAVDRDIEAMPMGMFTGVSENSASFSGGQVQRILLAAALVRNPSILFLDEATNWLDQNTQQKVMHGLENLNITRVVNAHRLSTIRKADRIYLLGRGRVLEEGTHDELMAEKGRFREMVLRQTA